MQVKIASVNFRAAAPGPASINASLVALRQLDGASASSQALAASATVSKSHAQRCMDVASAVCGE